MSGFSAWLKKFEATLVGRYVLSFTRAFLAVFLPGLIALAANVSVAHNWSVAWVALGALVSGAAAAAFRALQTGLSNKAT